MGSFLSGGYLLVGQQARGSSLFMEAWLGLEDLLLRLDASHVWCGVEAVGGFGEGGRAGTSKLSWVGQMIRVTSPLGAGLRGMDERVMEGDT